MAYDGFVEQELPTIPEHLSSPPGKRADDLNYYLNIR
jgi:hypothetical protein